MTRSIIAGTSDYSGQSLKDIVDDLKDWQISIKEVQRIYTDIINEFENSRYWEQVDYDFKASCYFLKKDFINSLIDIDEILLGIDQEIKEYHVILAKQRGSNAQNHHMRHRRVWQKSNVDYDGSENFKKLEILYEEGTSMTLDMTDLINLSERLQDFVGRKSNIIPSSITYTTNINAPIQNYMQNNNTQNVYQNNGYSSRNVQDIKQLKAILEEFKQLIHEQENKEFGETYENILDIENEVNKDQFKKNRIKSFGKSLINDMEKFNTINTFSMNISDKINHFAEIIEKLS